MIAKTYIFHSVNLVLFNRLDKDEIIDATKTGAMARFMNHCCEPNAYARIISCNTDHEEEKHIVIMAARDIQVRIRYFFH